MTSETNAHSRVSSKALVTNLKLLVVLGEQLDLDEIDIEVDAMW